MTREEAARTGEKFYEGRPCLHCGGTRRRTSTRGCVPCSDARSRAWHDANPDKARCYGLRHRFGLTAEAFDEMWGAQGGGCAICREPLRRGTGGACVDHNHTTGAVRALLCMDCNTGIGKLREDPRIFHAALAYLEQHRTAARASEETQ